MIRIVGVQFRGAGKIYSFSAGELELPVGTGVIVETAQGSEYGLVVTAAREESEETAPEGLKPVIRVATPEDIKRVQDNTIREQDAYRICLRKIGEHKLDMKLVEVEYAFDGSKILFYFTSDDRVDFRELVKDLGSTFHTRIELRQIGVRDEARTLGGLGICGRPFCCSTFLTEFQPVSIKMAKEQGLSLNPTKISGTCGRLMCCLKYEQEAYEDLIRRTAPVGSYVQTPEGNGYVTDYYLLTGVLKVKMEDGNDTSIHCFKNDQVTVLKRPDRSSWDGKKNGESHKQDRSAQKQERNEFRIPKNDRPAKKERPADKKTAEMTETKATPKVVVNALLFDEHSVKPARPQGNRSNGERISNGERNNGERNNSRRRFDKRSRNRSNERNGNKSTADAGSESKE